MDRRLRIPAIDSSRQRGILYLVATPIGNLEDMSFRAVRVLKEVDLIACEDTRQTRKLLDHYGIQKPVISYHEHNEAERAEQLSAKLGEGTSIALVSDAGMPLVSDPGYRLVAAALQEQIRVVPIPGPSAIVSALAASGLPTDRFFFGGFLPAKSGRRQKTLQALQDETATLVFFEAPHRILESLADVEQVLGPRPVVVARELTKMHEEFLRGTARDVRSVLADREAVKGEITLLIGQAQEAKEHDESLEEAIERQMQSGLSRMEAVKAVARQRGLPKREVYKHSPHKQA